MFSRIDDIVKFLFKNLQLIDFTSVLKIIFMMMMYFVFIIIV